MKPIAIASLLTVLAPQASWACCPEWRQAEIAGWSRDGSKAVVFLRPDNLSDEVDLPPCGGRCSR